MSQNSTRRQFLRDASGLACAPLFFPGLSLQKPAPQRPRNLVLLELRGGVDGLGILVPRDDDDYRRLRPTLGIPPESLLGFDDERGFAPHLAGLHALWNEGRMGIVQGVGYPNSSMSHFQGRAIWGTSLPNHTAGTSGWVARMRRHLWGDDPNPELLTHVGVAPSAALKAPGLPVLCFDRPEDMQWIAPCGPDEHGTEAPGTGPAQGTPQSQGILSKLRGTLSISQRLGPQLQQISANYKPKVEYPATLLGKRLRTIAGLIEAGFASRVYSLQHGDFDIHDSSPMRTVQAPGEFAQGISAFMKDLEGSSAFQDTLVLCYSEFGRRPKENSAGGCDHGAAGMMFLFGGNMRAGLFGQRPSITKLDSNGNMIPNMDFRRVYAAVIEQWFGADHEPVLLEKLAVPELI